MAAKCKPEGGYWYPATIEEVYYSDKGRKASYLVRWTDGDTRDTFKYERDLSKNLHLKMVFPPIRSDSRAIKTPSRAGRPRSASACSSSCKAIKVEFFVTCMYDDRIDVYYIKSDTI